MTVGQRLKQARLEAGLSQRQLCGTVITRNMLSQIENGTARPSMDTLSQLARALGKPVSFFLEEDAVLSPNQAVMQSARQAMALGESLRGLDVLAQYRGPDPVFDWERFLLQAELCLSLAEQALAEGKLPYARHLLDRAEEAGKETPYYGEGHRRRWLCLLARTGPEQAKLAAAQLRLDEELLLLAQGAMPGEPEKAAALLDAARDRQSPRWNLLRGQAACQAGDYAGAVQWLHRAEEAFPQQAVPVLEQCYREQGDYKMAYVYACKQKGRAAK